MKQYRLFFLVFTIHCVLLAALIWMGDITHKERERTHLEVQTFTTSAPPPDLAFLDEMPLPPPPPQEAVVEEAPPPQEEPPPPEPEVEQVAEEKPPVEAPPAPCEKPTAPKEKPAPPKEKPKVIPKEKPKPKVAAQKPPPAKPKVAPKKASAKSAVKAPVKKAAPAKTVAKKATTPAKKSTSQAAVAKPTRANEAKLRALMEESLASLEKGTPKAKVAPAAPVKKLSSLASESIKGTSAESCYEEQLTCYLKRRLSLPDAGNVKLRLTLTADGTVAAVTILSSSSAKNRSLVEEKLPKISFPPLGDRFEGEKSHTFSITLKSDS